MAGFTKSGSRDNFNFKSSAFLPYAILLLYFFYIHMHLSYQINNFMFVYVIVCMPSVCVCEYHYLDPRMFPTSDPPNSHCSQSV